MTRSARPVPRGGSRPTATAAALLTALLAALVVLAALLVPAALDGPHPRAPQSLSGGVEAGGAPVADDAPPAVRTAAARVHGDLPAPPPPAGLAPRDPAGTAPPGTPAPPTAVPPPVRPRPADGHPLRAPPPPPGT
ncbi:hypothetical protein [Streptomyces sp. NPDC017202]|uniref:hypothetical protein n=1 Tax=Streptomyces sp. NPDC017202 TaxID=3364981 RepID=UPI0037BAB55C